MLDQLLHSWPVLAVLAILSGVVIILKHVLPADSKITAIIMKILDILTGNVAH